MEHSKTPWTVNEHLSLIRDAYGNALASLPYTLGDEQDRANAEFIVRAVNSHDELLHYLEMMVKWAEDTVVPRVKDEDILPIGWERALAAIAKAKGE